MVDEDSIEEDEGVTRSEIFSSVSNSVREAKDVEAGIILLNNLGGDRANVGGFDIKVRCDTGERYDGIRVRGQRQVSL